jgi:hypothetical protein
MGGIRISSTNDDTIFPNAAPMITPTARSITLPRITNALKSFAIDMVELLESSDLRRRIIHESIVTV